MEKDQYIKYVQPLANFYKKRNPNYITNKQIEHYIHHMEYEKNELVISALIEYYHENKTGRSCLFQFARNMGLYIHLDNHKLNKNMTCLPLKFSEYENSLKLRRYSQRTIKIYTKSLLSVHNWLKDNLKIAIGP